MGLDSNNEVIGDVDLENRRLKEKVNLRNKIIVEMENVNKLQKLRIAELEIRCGVAFENLSSSTPQPRAPQYSDVLKKSSVSPNVLIVKPVDDKQIADVTYNQVKEAIDPGRLCIEINSVVPRKDGSVLISCKDPNNLNVLQRNIDHNEKRWECIN
ncbi:hypothetical protein QE152_g25475 [Popillia japonica]|uniref:Uncharacterized protein n=1 Tax=Popillia japonica TaxID=7064 RepID=A0AAW1K1G3_POPJA